VTGPVPSRFPDPASAPADAPLARGGDLDPDTLLDAYRNGIFPWPVGDRRLYWWSPDPRAVWPAGTVHVSRSLRRVIRSGRFTTTFDTDFAAVAAACAHRPGEGTWITPAMRAAYLRLHRYGIAHSVEVRDAHGALVGGLYGLALGGAFMAESMFHRARDASKVALVALDAHLAGRGFALIDGQLPTPHLASMGALTIPRAAYLRLLRDALRMDVSFGA
jgi:leucyl/phenylalanyl-tRNA---protein transferase